MAWMPFQKEKQRVARLPSSGDAEILLKSSRSLWSSGQIRNVLNGRSVFLILTEANKKNSRDFCFKLQLYCMFIYNISSYSFVINWLLNPEPCYLNITIAQRFHFLITVALPALSLLSFVTKWMCSRVDEAKNIGLTLWND